MIIHIRVRGNLGHKVLHCSQFLLARCLSRLERQRIGQHVFQIFLPDCQELAVISYISQPGQAVQIICRLLETPPVGSPALGIAFDFSGPERAVVRIVHCFRMARKPLPLASESLLQPALRGNVGNEPLGEDRVGRSRNSSGLRTATLIRTRQCHKCEKNSQISKFHIIMWLNCNYQKV